MNKKGDNGSPYLIPWVGMILPSRTTINNNGVNGARDEFQLLSFYIGRQQQYGEKTEYFHPLKKPLKFTTLLPTNKLL